jgi:gliding motility-associated-like protein
MELIIYDRWGQKVFETTDPTAAWDGLTRGTENQPGAYGYILRVVCEGGGMHQEQGSITLMR